MTDAQLDAVPCARGLPRPTESVGTLLLARIVELPAPLLAGPIPAPRHGAMAYSALSAAGLDVPSAMLLLLGGAGTDPAPVLLAGLTSTIAAALDGIPTLSAEATAAMPQTATLAAALDVVRVTLESSPAARCAAVCGHVPAARGHAGGQWGACAGGRSHNMPHDLVYRAVPLVHTATPVFAPVAAPMSRCNCGCTRLRQFHESHHSLTASFYRHRTIQ